MKKLSIFLTLIFFSSCGVVMEPMPKSWHWGIKPRPLTGVRNFPEADTDYGQGFKNGCEAAWAQSTKGLTVKNTKINTAMIVNNPDYNSGWFDGNEQCTYIVDWDVV